MRILLVCHYIHHLFFFLEFILIFFFLLLISTFISFVPYSLTAHVHECLHAPLPSFAFLSLCFSLFLYCLFSFLSVPYIFCLIYFMWYLDSINHTFHIGNSQVSREMGQIGSLENFSTTSRTYGFSLYFKVRIFLPCGPDTCGSTRHSSP